MKNNKTWIIAAAVIIGISAVVFFWKENNDNNAGNQSPKGEIDFNLAIRPILSDRCFKCHGPDANKRKAGLRLDIADSAYKALKDNPDAHILVAGKPELSELYRRISTTDTAEIMPPVSSNLKLNDLEIALIKKWIEQGAKYKPHWAFIPPQPRRLPAVADTKWPRTQIDYFTLAKMESEGLSPNKEADKERLLKRVYFDITGLPPSIEDQENFLNDNSPDAYENVVDRLLADQHYGEKMAVSWLDVARYADSHGYQDDGLRTMWPWRDWVINAFNKNYSYAKFVKWQLAGDLLPNPSKEMLLATGFNRNHKITQEGGVIDEEYRVEYVTDRTNTFSKAFLALTMECAHCHDHKYDPISQKDYYSTYAFFNQVNEKGLQGDISLASLADPPKMEITTADVQHLLSFVNKKDTAPVQVMIMENLDTLRKTYVLTRGLYDQHGAEVSFNTPARVFPFDSTRYPESRLGLADWLLDKNNPLTARVFVNRIWQEFFGRGLVKTSGDFGLQGEMPTHPELLDWLALDFVQHDWNIKRLVKQIVMSATYRESDITGKKAAATDPENIYLSHAPRTRFTAEGIRDMVLASSGLLVKDIGGPSVKPYMPKGIWEASTSGRGQLAKYVQDHGDALYRRGMYTFIKRTVPSPVMLTFDASSRDQCEVRRLNTNTPLQALVLLNDPQVLEAARVLSERLMKENTSPEDKIKKAFRLIICRNAKNEEIDILNKYFNAEQQAFLQSKEKAKAFIKAGEYRHEAVNNVAQLAALMQVVHTVYNMEEAVVK